MTIEGGPFLDKIIKSSSRSIELLNRLEILHKQEMEKCDRFVELIRKLEDKSH